MIITLRVNNPFEDKVQPALDYCRYVIENPKLAEHRDNFILGDYIKVTDGKISVAVAAKNYNVNSEDVQARIDFYHSEEYHEYQESLDFDGAGY